MGTELDKLRELESRKREVISDGNLSQEGKRLKLNEIDNEKKAYYPKALAGMKASVIKAKDEFKQAEKKLSDAYDNRENVWNFERLNYYSRQVAGEFDKASNITDASHIYEGFKNSPDRHIRRVASESANIIRKRFGADGTELIGKMKADNENLLKSEDIEQAEQEAEITASKMVGLVNEVKTVSEFYKPDGFPGGADGFDDVLAGVRIESKVDASSPNRFEKITVSVD